MPEFPVPDLEIPEDPPGLRRCNLSQGPSCTSRLTPAKKNTHVQVSPGCVCACACVFTGSRMFTLAAGLLRSLFSLSHGVATLQYISREPPTPDFKVFNPPKSALYISPAVSHVALPNNSILLGRGLSFSPCRVEIKTGGVSSRHRSHLGVIPQRGRLY